MGVSNQSNGFTFGSWNAGTSDTDYKQLFPLGGTKEQPNIHELDTKKEDEKQMLASISAVREKLLADTSQDLAKTVDVMALQEVPGDDRQDIKAFAAEGFEIIRPSSRIAGNTDVAIAISPEKFENIQDKSFVDEYSSTEFAIAVATEKSTGKKVAFVSAHIGGFNLDMDPQYMKDAAETGDNSIKRLLEMLQDACKDCDTVIIGADTNAIPEVYQPRFDLFKEAGFDLFSTNEATNKQSHHLGNDAGLAHQIYC